MSFALVIGAGPAGLMAAQEIVRAGHRVVIAEAKPSPARKFLMAGKSGLNLTKAEDPETFARHYGTAQGWLAPMLCRFGPPEVMDWARGLGQAVFTGSSGRVFPRSMKASPLLRAWLRRLQAEGAELRTRWRWRGFEDGFAVFDTPEGRQSESPGATVLALGGASWARLGSDGAWAPHLAECGAGVAPFRPANMGFTIDWSPHMVRHFGTPVKPVTLIAGGQHERGEFVVSARGIEGGGVYAVSAALRDGAALRLDLAPDLTQNELIDRLNRGKPGDSTANRLRKLGLAPVAIALLQEFARPLPPDPATLAGVLKSLPVPIRAPRPLDEAISVAGGVTRDSLSDGLELHALPGVFACGEMLDWEAPTGGYLLTACLSTGYHAGRSAAARISAGGQSIA